jgi:hypothetical protein
MDVMTKKQKLSAGTRVVVRAGVSSPDFAEILFEGWTGTIVEVSRKKSGMKYILQWDDAVIENMPKDYLDKCEEFQLFHSMACLDETEIAHL